jgi:hypothetical protein
MGPDMAGTLLRAPVFCASFQHSAGPLRSVGFILVLGFMSELSQNYKALLQEVGEGAVVISLAVRMADKPGWTLFKNFTEHGCDLVLQRRDSNHETNQVKIEVKTRQNILTKRVNRGALHFTVTPKERESADFLVAYWFDRHTFFIVPSAELKPVKVHDGVAYKFIAYWSEKQGCFTADSDQWRDRWDLILGLLQ